MISCFKTLRLRIALSLVTGLFIFLSCPSPQAFAGESKTNLSIPEDRLEQILTAAEKNLGRIKTLQTKMIQEKNISLFSEPVLSKGIFLFKNPNKIRLEFFEPFQSILLVSGGKISKFEAFNGEWKRMNPGNEKIMGIILDHIAAWVKGRFNQGDLYEISGKYRQVTESKKKQSYTLILEPRAQEFKKFIQAFELGINSDMDRLDYIIIRESGNDYTQIDFHDDRINLPIDDKYFDGNQDFLSPISQW